jgi:uncharacterized RDD family membrane protein YckC
MIDAPARLTSGEGVALELNHAGVGSRVIAALIDLVLQIIALFILLAVTGETAANADPAAAAALVIVEVVLVFGGYPTIMEWLSHGRTVGKLWLGLRVVRDDGGPIGFRQALARGLASLLLEKPGLLVPISTAAAVMTMIFSPKDKRLGDMMGGTFVLNERAGSRQTLVARDFAVPHQLYPWTAALDLSRLDDQLALCVRQFVIRAHEMTPAAQYFLGEELRARIEAITAPAPPPGTPTPWMLTTVLAERRRRAELVAQANRSPYAARAAYPAQPPYPPTPYAPAPYAPAPTQPPYAPVPAQAPYPATQPPPDDAPPSDWERPDAAPSPFAPPS